MIIIARLIDYYDVDVQDIMMRKAWHWLMLSDMHQMLASVGRTMHGNA